MAPDANIVLMGFMGTGKTTVGRLLASRLGRPFVDMDAVIEAREGRAISAIFAKEGEAHFRKLERALAVELAGRAGQVIATGGGVVLNPDNVTDFRRTGIVVCLTAPPETILRRVAGDAHRPLLEDGEKTERIRRLLEVRRPFYEALPHRLDTAGSAPEALVERLLEIISDETA